MFLWSRKQGNFQKQQKTSALLQMPLMVRGVDHVLEGFYHQIERNTKWNYAPVTQWHRGCPGVQAPSMPQFSTPHTVCFHGAQLFADFRDGEGKDFRSRRIWGESMTLAELRRTCTANAAPISGPIRRAVPWGCGKLLTLSDPPQSLLLISAVNTS